MCMLVLNIHNYWPNPIPLPSRPSMGLLRYWCKTQGVKRRDRALAQLNMTLWNTKDLEIRKRNKKTWKGQNCFPAFFTEHRCLWRSCTHKKCTQREKHVAWWAVNKGRYSFKVFLKCSFSPFVTLGCIITNTESCSWHRFATPLSLWSVTSFKDHPNSQSVKQGQSGNAHLEHVHSPGKRNGKFISPLPPLHIEISWNGGRTISWFIALVKKTVVKHKYKCCGWRGELCTMGKHELCFSYEVDVPLSQV